MRPPHGNRRAERPDQAGSVAVITTAAGPRWTRLAVVFALAAGFVVIASLIVPKGTRASLSLGQEQPAEAVTPVVVRPGLIGTLEVRSHTDGSTYRLDIFTGPDEPLYTVYDANNRALAEGLTAYQVNGNFPDIGLDTLRMDGLGLVDIPVDGPGF